MSVALEINVLLTFWVCRTSPSQSIEGLVLPKGTAIIGSDFLASPDPSASLSTLLLVRLKLVADPQSPVVEVPPWSCLLQELTRIENSVIGLSPDVTIHLPSRLCTLAAGLRIEQYYFQKP